MLTEDQKAEAEKLVASGKTREEIAAEVGVNPNTLSSHFFRRGLTDKERTDKRRSVYEPFGPVTGRGFFDTTPGRKRRC